MASNPEQDVLIIGGGHNGLVCAAYLAGAGLKVRVLERRGIVGGAAVTEEFHPGFRNSTASYTVSLLNPKVIADLRLHEHGLRVVERPYANFLPLPDGRAFRLGGERTQDEIAKWSRRDAERLPEYYAMLDRVVHVLRELMVRTPPNVSDRFVLADWLASYDVARRLKHLDMRGRRDLLDLFTKSAGELLDAYFESEPVKAVLGWDSVVGNFASPYTPGSAYVLLHHVFGEVNGKRGAWGHAIGGMGAITQAMAKCAMSRGVDIRLNAGVREIIMTVPTPDGERNDLVLAAALLCGVDRVFAVGGAQAIAALAYGTATVPQVDKIVRRLPRNRRRLRSSDKRSPRPRNRQNPRRKLSPRSRRQPPDRHAGRGQGSKGVLKFATRAGLIAP